MANLSSTSSAAPAEAARWTLYDLEMLNRVQRRVLWLSTYMVHYANFVRANPDPSKVGGHQASSASVVTLLTALYFYFLRPGDLVSVKPHASPVFHAIQFLRGLLPQEKLKAFRQYGGLQSYPSRTKDPDGVDFSTGSVGLGAAAPLFGALVRDYVADHFGTPGTSARPGSGWQIALVGDAELDEGNVWEALGEEFSQRTSKVLWLVDLNRQSLDRVIPDGRANKLRETFRSNGWRVIDLKYGKKLEAVFHQPYGLKLRALIDEMTNEEYQALLLKDGETIRARLIQHAAASDGAMAQLLAPYNPAQVKELLANLGGHDVESVLEAYEAAFAVRGQPVCIFAYTHKGWGLRIASHPANHARLLKQAELDQLRQELGIVPGEEFSGFHPDGEEARYIRQRLDEAGRLANGDAGPGREPIEIPASLGLSYKGMLSTQSALGSVLVNLARDPKVAPYLVTASPDVAMSTNLGGWIHRVGIYSRRKTRNYFKEEGIPLLIDWQESLQGKHIELGISETNLMLLLGMLGLAGELYGQALLPVGTVYDPFVCRALDAFIYGIYSHARFIVAGTPSGLSLSYEGGAHQSVITPGIGVQLPGLAYYEPAYGRELEWIFLASLLEVSKGEAGRSAYLRLSTKPIEQGLFDELMDRLGEEQLRAKVLKGGYRLLDWQAQQDYRVGANVVHIFVSGAMVPEAVAAARALGESGIYANVFNVTSADLLFHDQLAAQKRRIAGGQQTSWLEQLVPAPERAAPIVTVHDAHPLSLAFIGGALATRTVSLGVTEFGQSGSQPELYRAYGISTENVVEAAKRIVQGD